MRARGAAATQRNGLAHRHRLLLAAGLLLLLLLLLLLQNESRIVEASDFLNFFLSVKKFFFALLSLYASTGRAAADGSRNHQVNTLVESR